MKRFIFSLLFAASVAQAGRHPDTYKNFADLAQHEVVDRDYTITVEDRGAAVSVFAIHGGGIDLDTHRLAEALAEKKWNLYVFKGIKRIGNWKLHVTSAHFDEPRAVALAQKSDQCVSIHGHANSEARICLGGADRAKRERMGAALLNAKLPFEIVSMCTGLEGTDPKNIVNRCQNGGVQLEFSSALREKLFTDQKLFDRTILAIRSGVRLEPEH